MAFDGVSVQKVEPVQRSIGNLGCLIGRVVDRMLRIELLSESGGAIAVVNPPGAGSRKQGGLCCQMAGAEM